MYAPTANETTTLAETTTVGLERRVSTPGQLEVEDIIDTFPGPDLLGKKLTDHVPENRKEMPDTIDILMDFQRYCSSVRPDRDETRSAWMPWYRIGSRSSHFWRECRTFIRVPV